MFSVIIPIYNVEEYIEMTLNSILSQTFLDYEIIIVDDGSTDNSYEICNKYRLKHKNIKLIQQKNKGVSVARNNALSIATGTYILFVDGDDYLNDNSAFQTLFNFLKKKGFPDFVYNDVVKCLIMNRKIKIAKFRLSDDNFNLLQKEKALDSFLVNSQGYPWSVWGNLYKKHIIEENKDLIFLQNISLGEDADWLFRFILKCDTVDKISYPFYTYRIGREKSAMSEKSYRHVKSYLEIIKKWMLDESVEKLTLEKIQMKLVSNFLDYFAKIYTFSDEQKRCIISQLIDIKFTDYLKNKAQKRRIDKKGYYEEFRRAYITEKYFSVFGKIKNMR